MANSKLQMAEELSDHVTMIFSPFAAYCLPFSVSVSRLTLAINMRIILHYSCTLIIYYEETVNANLPFAESLYFQNFMALGGSYCIPSCSTFGCVDEIWRNISTVKFHPFDQLQLIMKCLAIL